MNLISLLCPVYTLRCSATPDHISHKWMFMANWVWLVLMEVHIKHKINLAASVF